MPRKKEGRETIQVLFTTEEYENIKRYAAITNQSMSTIVRKFTTEGIIGELTEKNIDFLTPIIRSQLKSIMDMQYERQAAMIAKTCIQAGAAAYLSAEALNSFVPDDKKRDFLSAYEAARKKAVQYLRSSVLMDVTVPDDDGNDNWNKKKEK